MLWNFCGVKVWEFYNLSLTFDLWLILDEISYTVFRKGLISLFYVHFMLPFQNNILI